MKVKKLLAAVLAMVMILCMIPVAVSATSAASSDASSRVLNTNSILRVYGDTRFETSAETADQLKKALGVSKFSSIIIANGNNFPDALSGSYLATVKNAPILIVDSLSGYSTSEDLVVSYVEENLQSNGTVYILGGTSAVSDWLQGKLENYGTVKRLSGDTRYDTNLAILKAAGIKGDEMLVADASTNNSFADALSGSSTGKPMLLVNKGDADQNGNYSGKLTTAQVNYLKSSGIKKVTILGGTKAVPSTIENQIKNLGITVSRAAGETRYETSAKVAAKYFPKASTVTLAWGGNFPDALCGGPLAYAMGAPVVLTQESNTYAKSYTSKLSNFKVVAFGGAGANKNQLTNTAINDVKTGTIAESKYATASVESAYQRLKAGKGTCEDKEIVNNYVLPYISSQTGLKYHASVSSYFVADGKKYTISVGKAGTRFDAVSSAKELAESLVAKISKDVKEGKANGHPVEYFYAGSWDEGVEYVLYSQTDTSKVNSHYCGLYIHDDGTENNACEYRVALYKVADGKAYVKVGRHVGSSNKYVETETQTVPIEGNTLNFVAEYSDGEQDVFQLKFNPFNETVEYNATVMCSDYTVTRTLSLDSLLVWDDMSKSIWELGE